MAHICNDKNCSKITLYKKRYCEEHSDKCSLTVLSKGCENRVSKRSMRCEEHSICVNPGCENRVSKRSMRCEEHTYRCKINDCLNRVSKKDNRCEEHSICVNPGCENKLSPNANLYCEKHYSKCRTPNCSNRAEKNQRCEEHQQCNYKDCSNPVSYKKQYCEKHAYSCKTEWCFKERFEFDNMRCEEHKDNANMSGYDLSKPGIIYFIYHPEFGVRKIGITNVSATRMAWWKSQGWKIIMVLEFEDGSIPQYIEKQWKVLAKKLGLFPALTKEQIGSRGGWTETFPSEEDSGISNKSIIQMLQFIENKSIMF